MMLFVYLKMAAQQNYLLAALLWPLLAFTFCLFVAFFCLNLPTTNVCAIVQVGG